MKIFKDIISGDEMASDSFPMEVVDDCAYKITTKIITRTEGNYDTAGDGLGEETYDPTSVSVNNLIDAHRLAETSFDKKSYMTYIKGYMQALKKRIEASNPSRVDAFMKGAQAFVKKVMADFSEYSFYTGESMNPDAMVALLRYSEDGQTPYIYLFVDGLREEKY